MNFPFTSVAWLCPTFCDPMDRSTPDFPVHHPLPEFAQTDVHQVSDAIQPSHPLSPPSPPAFILFPASVFSSESVFRIRWPKYWSFSFSISPSNQAPPFTSCVTLGFVPRFHHLSSGVHSSICLIELLWGLNELIILKAPRIMPGIL